MARKPPSIFDRIGASVTAATTVPKKKKGGAKAPPSSRRGLRDDATVWAAEQMLQPWELPKPTVPRRPAKTFAADKARREREAKEARQAAKEAERVREARVEWAKRSILPGSTGQKARRKLAATTTDERREEIRERGVERVPKDDFKKYVQRRAIDNEIAKATKAKDAEKVKKLTALRQMVDAEEFNPASWAGKAALGGLKDVARVADVGLQAAYEGIFDEDQRRELGAYFNEVMGITERGSKGTTSAINRYLAARSGNAEAMGIPIPERLKKIARASVRTGVESTIGLAPGAVYMAGNLGESLNEYERYIRNYYGPMLHGDFTPLEEEGITPGLFDVLGVASVGLGAAGRVGALSRTARYGGPLRKTAGGKRMGPITRYGRAAVLGQEPVPILGTMDVTMGRRVPYRAVEREEPVPVGEAIQSGDRIEYRRTGEDEVRSITVDDDSALIGNAAPDINNPERVQIGKDSVDVLSAYRMGEFEQRMSPRSPIGQMISDFYWWAKPSTGRGAGLLTGKGSRTKLRRQAAEIQEDRFRGQIKAFMKDHKSIQQDVIQSTAYDRMLRYADPELGVARELAARRQRGLDETREQRQVIASLEAALEHIQNPSERLQAAVAAGRVLSMDTEQFLISRGLLTPERADVAKLAAERWIQEGHLRDEPLDSPRRTQVRDELLEHFYGDEEMTDLAMAWTDTLARADAAGTGRNPVDWYEENIRSVETTTPERIEEIASGEPGLLRQEREVKRTPRPGEAFPMRDPETGHMRVARMIEALPDEETFEVNIQLAEQKLVQVSQAQANAALPEQYNQALYQADRDLTRLRERKADAGMAIIQWVREPNAGERIRVPLSAVQGNTSRIHGWYSPIANEVERLPERVSRQEAESRLRKAPGVKKDEWEAMNMDAALDAAFAGNVKSIHRDDLRHAVRANTPRFETDHLDRESAYYETQFSVTLDGPRWDYSETLLYYPERWVQEDTHSDYAYERAHESWYEDMEQQLQEARLAAEENPDSEVLQDDVAHIENRINHGPDSDDIELYLTEQEPPLFSASHFTEDQSPGQYADDSSEYNRSGNLMAWTRQSGRWADGAPLTILEEGQSDIHQKALDVVGETTEGYKIRRGYRTAEDERVHAAAEATASAMKSTLQTKEMLYGNDFVRKVEREGGDLHVRVVTSGEEGNIIGGSYGEHPYFRVEIEPARPAQGERIRKTFGELEVGDRVWTIRGDSGVMVQDAQGKAFQADAGGPPQFFVRPTEFYASDPEGYVPGKDAVTVRAHYRDLEPTSDPDLRDRFEEMREAQGDYDDAQYEARQAARKMTAPPDIPWKGAKWEELLFREAVRTAVYNGQTRLGWTTGKQQAERYNSLLAENVRRLEWDGDSLEVTDAGGGFHTYSTAASDLKERKAKLVEYVGTGLADKLQKQLDEQGGDDKFDLILMERPKHGPDGEFTEWEGMRAVPVEDFQPGDILYVSQLDPTHAAALGYQRLQFQVNDQGRIIDRHTTITARALAERDGLEFPFPFNERGMNPEQFRLAAEKIQRETYETTGRRATGVEPAVLEGEGISIGGGGFIDAYDRRWVSYAKKYLGVVPRKIALDDLSYDVLYASTPEHPDHQRYSSLVQASPAFETDTPIGTREARAVEYRENVLEPALAEIGPIYRVKAGDTILSESESLQAALQTAYAGGPNAGHWPQRVRQQENGQWAIHSRGGAPGQARPTWDTPGDARYDTFQEALDALNGRFEGYYDSARISIFDRNPTGVGAVTEESRGAGEVWVVDIPEEFATKLHEQGSPLFQRRRGSINGLARLTEEGADIYLDRDSADIATWIEESAHAVIPDWFDQADAVGDARADYIRAYVEAKPGEPIGNEANERLVKVLQAWVMQGSTPAPQMRSLFRGLSQAMKDAYEGGLAKIEPDPVKRKRIEKMLDDPAVTSFLRDQFDVAPYRDFDPGAVAFQTMRQQGRFTRPGSSRVAGAVRSLTPSRRKMAKAPNTMRAFESGEFDVGPDMTAHYANAELRTRTQDEQARKVLRYQEPMEIVNGVPVLKPGYQIYNYHGIRRANQRLNEMFLRSERYGDITDSEEPMLSADPTMGSALDMDPEDFTDLAGDTAGAILKEEMLYDSVPDAQAFVGDRLVEMVREGKIGQIPTDVAETFLNASGAGYALATTSTILRGIATFIRVPSMLARWRMIGKAAYPITNTAYTGLLVGLNQGPMLPFNVIQQYGHRTRSTRIRLLSEVGVGVAELTDVPPLVGRNRLERWQAKEQDAFRKAMHVLSTPESHVRLTQIINDLGDAGYRNEADTVRLLDLVKEGNPEATRLLNQVARNSEDAVVRFRGLRAEEQFLVRDMIFVYGWLRAATRFTLRFPMERPVTAAIMYHIGQYGWEKLQEEFYALAWEQQGSISLGQKSTTEGFLRRIMDLSQAMPFKSGLELMRPILQVLGLQDTGLRPASFADLLSPSADFALRSIYGADPRFGTDFWSGLKYDVDPRNLPGVYWAARFIDPSLTGSKLRADRDRWDIVLNFFAGMSAPYEIRESVSYERWLEQQPAELRTLIREQNDANQLALYGEAAAKVEGGALDMGQLRAINADSAYRIYSSLLQTKLRREKNDSEFYLSAIQRSASRAKVMQEYFPEAYADAANATGSLDVKTPEGEEEYIDTWDDAWEDVVSDELSSVREMIEENLGFEAPDSSKVPFKRQARNFRWLQTAPPASLDRIRKVMERKHVSPDDELGIADIIEDEMRRLTAA
jgi:hypothetical protein